MPYIQGDDLATVLRREGTLPIASRAAARARRSPTASQAAHDAGVVHRDLKPANIMIGGAEDEHALIMDFGISASADEAADGRIVGTLEYMSPEQGLGQTVDARADLYAFGLILYEMLVGRRSAPTTTAEERFAAMKQRFEEGLPPLRTSTNRFPSRSRRSSTRCLERDPGARYQTTAELCAGAGRARRRRRADSGAGAHQQAGDAGRSILLFCWCCSAASTSSGGRFAPVAPPAHEPVSVLIADFDNRSGRPGLRRRRRADAGDRAGSGVVRHRLQDDRRARDRGAAHARQGRPDHGGRRTADRPARRHQGAWWPGAIDKRGTGYPPRAAGDRPGERHSRSRRPIGTSGQGAGARRGRRRWPRAFARRSANHDRDGEARRGRNDHRRVARRDARLRARAGAADGQPVPGGAAGISARGGPRSAVRPRLLGHGRRLRQLPQAAGQGRGQLQGGAEPSRSHDGAREISDARHLLPERRAQLREGDRELRGARQGCTRPTTSATATWRWPTC